MVVRDLNSRSLISPWRHGCHNIDKLSQHRFQSQTMILRIISKTVRLFLVTKHRVAIIYVKDTFMMTNQYKYMIKNENCI